MSKVPVIASSSETSASSGTYVSRHAVLQMMAITVAHWQLVSPRQRAPRKAVARVDAPAPLRAWVRAQTGRCVPTPCMCG